MIPLIQEKRKVIASSFSKAKGEREGGAQQPPSFRYHQDLAPQASALTLANLSHEEWVLLKGLLLKLTPRQVSLTLLPL